MTIGVRVCSGSRTGLRQVFAGSPVVLGRDPSSTVDFDPEGDLEVSARHAALVLRAAGWFVQDLGSRNGTFLDGLRVSGETRIEDGSRLRLGPNGPELELRLDVAPGFADAEADSGGQPRQARPMWSAGIAIGALLGGGLVLLAVGLALRGSNDRAAWERQRAELLALLDSVVAAHASSTAELAGAAEALDDSLRSASLAIRELRTELEATAPGERVGTGEDDRMVDLERRLIAATAELTRARFAASFRWEDVADRAAPSVALLFVEDASGQVEAGTAFLVDSGGIYVTVSHLVGGRSGQRSARRIAVQLAGDSSLHQAELVLADPEHDVALLRGPRGRAPLALESSDALRLGQPVLVVGFPLAGGTLSVLGPPLSTVGLLASSEPDRLEVRGYSDRGGSGSPVLDSTGRVVGLIRGATGSAEQRRLVGVPTARIRDLLGSVEGLRRPR